jgi:hypothetical protein
MVHVGAFFPIHFDIDEVGIHESRYGGIFEGFPFHDVAPVAGRITNTHQDGLSLFSRALKSFRLPRVPMYRVPCMLQQVWAGLKFKSVHAAINHVS